MNDFIIVGGGIVGVATALRIQSDYPGRSVVLLERESTLAAHQTGRNSGVVHAGIYYAPGSMKAEFCRRGLEATIAFCKAHDLPLEQCGKLIVATNSAELVRMHDLFERGSRNGLPLRLIDKTELGRLEPGIEGQGAILSPTTAITDYGAVTRKMAELFIAGGGTIRHDAEVVSIKETGVAVIVGIASGEDLTASHLICCAGANADRLAAMSGLAGDFAIVPFKGEYFRLNARHDGVVNHLIYPVPDPDLPFLGVHLTRMIGGYVTVGPNAVLSLARSDYRKLGFNARDVTQMLGFSGFWRTMAGNLGTGLHEAKMSLSRRTYLKSCQRYCPSLRLDDLEPHPSGIRAQAVMRDGTLAHDFMIRNTARTVHVCNAPSPAATSAIPIAEHIAGVAAGVFELGAVEH